MLTPYRVGLTCCFTAVGVGVSSGSMSASKVLEGF